MARSTLALTLSLALAVSAAAALAQTAAPAGEGYAWAEACRKCHEPVYDAWAKTKHASALDRLSSSDQEGECVGCHLTGPKAPVLDGKKVLNRGVQCEACHGAAAAHVADPSVKSGIRKVPDETLCQACHNDKAGSHFKGFFYGAMAGLSHKVQ